MSLIRIWETSALPAVVFLLNKKDKKPVLLFCIHTRNYSAFKITKLSWNVFDVWRIQVGKNCTYMWTRWHKKLQVPIITHIDDVLFIYTGKSVAYSMTISCCWVAYGYEYNVVAMLITSHVEVSVLFCSFKFFCK